MKTALFDESVTVYKDSSLSEPLDVSLPAGTEVKYEKASESARNIILPDGRPVYIKPDAKINEIRKYSLIEDEAPLYEEPSTQSAVKGQYQKGWEFFLIQSVIKDGKRWNKVRGSSGDEGFLKPNSKIRPIPNYWEVQNRDGKVIQYYSADSIKAAVLKGEISPDMAARQIDPSDLDMPPWEKVSIGLAKSSSAIQALFEPETIWSYSLRGAARGAKIGGIVWLALTFFAFVPLGNAVITFWLIVILFFLIWTSLSERFREKHPGIFRVSLYLMVMGFLSNLRMSFDQILKSSIAGLQIQSGAVLVGAILFVLPGMIVGTIIGRVRLSKIERSPFAPREGNEVLTKGIVFPAIGFAIILFLYILFVRWMDGGAGFKRAWEFLSK
jgi:hypothetical protein